MAASRSAELGSRKSVDYQLSLDSSRIVSARDDCESRAPRCFRLLHEGEQQADELGEYREDDGYVSRANTPRSSRSSTASSSLSLSAY